MSGIPAIPIYPMPSEDELPANVASWSVEPRRALLLVHDMQEYFLRPFAEPQRRALVSNAVRLRESLSAAGALVTFTAQPGDMTSHQRGLLADFWGPGMSASPADREIVVDLAPRPGDHLVTKWRYSAFQRSDLLEHMRANERDQLVICGVYAHVGVLMSAIDAFTHDIRAFVVADAVADMSADRHALALEYVASRCAMVATTETMLLDLAAAGLDDDLAGSAP